MGAVYDWASHYMVYTPNKNKRGSTDVYTIIPQHSNQWNPTTPVLIPSKAIFAELCIMQVVTGYLLRATEEDQAQQLKVFGGLGFP